jgi:hypothetical protein
MMKVISNIFCLISLHAFLVVAEMSDGSKQQKQQPAPKSSRCSSQSICVEVGENKDMVCTAEVLETREKYDGTLINVGVTQRVDGSETEKQAIRQVLKNMDNYFFNEVLALPEYEYARSRW